MTYKARTKFRAVKTVVDGITFDSKKEAYRYKELKLLEELGEISNLNLQVKYKLSDSVRVNGKVVMRGCSYIADFVYNEDGQVVVEDVKGFRTEDYQIKRKWMWDKYGILIREV